MDRLDAKAIKTYKEIILILDQCIVIWFVEL